MREDLRHRLELLVGNRQILSERYASAWGNLPRTLAASIFASGNAIADPARLRRSLSLLKQNTAPTSAFRNAVPRLYIAANLALDPFPAEKLASVLATYGKLRAHFAPSAYLAISSYLLDGKDTDTVARTYAFYRVMKDAHPFLVTGKSIPYAALTSTSDVSDKEFRERTEITYLKLRGSFPASSRLFASYLTAISKKDEQECFERLVVLFESLRAEGLRFGKRHELPLLALFALTDEDIDTVTDEMVQADEYLRSQRGFGASIGARSRLAFAAICLCQSYKNGESSQINALAAAAIASKLADESTAYQ